ncbi:MAG: hypothetical protein JWN31_283 [Frankiales bacterium]|nr:hypothetical protein [Frankiales bacterium]
MPHQPSRRTVLLAGALVPLATWIPGIAQESRALAAAGAGYRFLTEHQAATVVEATARLVPGPFDDPLEAGHPGAREADVVRYVDTLLSAFDEHPPRIFAGGPWSDRHSTGPDHAAHFVPLEERQLHAWRIRVAQLRRDVTAALTALDAAARADGFADFASAPTPVQDYVLTAETAARNVLFSLTVEGLYSLPEYGGNFAQKGWQEITWLGDVQPRGYSAGEVEDDDGFDPIGAEDLPVVLEALKNLPAVIAAMGGTTLG